MSKASISAPKTAVPVPNRQTISDVMRYVRSFRVTPPNGRPAIATRCLDCKKFFRTTTEHNQHLGQCNARQKRLKHIAEVRLLERRIQRLREYGFAV
jgi:hypothetical protein